MGLLSPIITILYFVLMYKFNDGKTIGKQFMKIKVVSANEKEIGINNLPGRNTLYDGMTRTYGKFPNWTFRDSPKQKEVLRRRNVFARFLSAYNRARIRFSDGFSDGV